MKTKKKAVKAVKASRVKKAVSILKKWIRYYFKRKYIELCISDGNGKIGRIKNISIAPILSCAGVCNHCMEHCYDLKAVLQYVDVAKARARNYVLLMYNPMEFYIQARRAIASQKKGLFRWNVGGEIVNLVYLQIIVKLAREFPKVKFLIFTKKHFLVNSYCERNGGRNAIPENLKLIFSFWPGMDLINPYNFPVSAPYIGKRPENWKECIGNCETCNDLKCGCWYLQSGETVGFKYHGTDEKAFSETFNDVIKTA